MLHILQTDTEVEYRHQQIRTQYIESQRMVSVAGMRQILGNSVIALGGRIHGMAQGSCEDAAESRELIREALRTSRGSHARIAG